MALLFYKSMGFVIASFMNGATGANHSLSCSFDIVDTDTDSDLDHEDDVDYWIMSKDVAVTRDA